VDPADKIELQDWMTAKGTCELMHALMVDGLPARFVGGCVRDAILGRAVKDIDIATPEPPEKVISLLNKAGLKGVPTGIDHGTITVIVEGALHQVTTLRVDVETYGRRAKVNFTDSWTADAQRRDFTMNALFCDPDGTIYDPIGGLSDLKEGRVQFVGSALERIEEDVLRLLRYFRLYAYYGTTSADEAALNACREMAPKINSLSVERVWSELRRLLLAPDPIHTLHLMRDWGVLCHALRESCQLVRLQNLVKFEKKLNIEANAIRRLSVLVELDGGGVSALADRLRLSKAESQHLRKLITTVNKPSIASSELDNKEIYYRLGNSSLFVDLALIEWASVGDGYSDSWIALAKMPDRMSLPVFPVKGADVLALGIPSGERVGEILSEIEDWWIKRNFEPDRMSCLTHLKKISL